MVYLARLTRVHSTALARRGGHTDISLDMFLTPEEIEYGKICRKKSLAHLKNIPSNICTMLWKYEALFKLCSEVTKYMTPLHQEATHLLNGVDILQKSFLKLSNCLQQCIAARCSSAVSENKSGDFKNDPTYLEMQREIFQLKVDKETLLAVVIELKARINNDLSN